jgi:hypothetical protein
VERFYAHNNKEPRILDSKFNKIRQAYDEYRRRQPCLTDRLERGDITKADIQNVLRALDRERKKRKGVRENKWTICCLEKWKQIKSRLLGIEVQEWTAERAQAVREKKLPNLLGYNQDQLSRVGSFMVCFSNVWDLWQVGLSSTYLLTSNPSTVGSASSMVEAKLAAPLHVSNSSTIIPPPYISHCLSTATNT